MHDHRVQFTTLHSLRTRILLAIGGSVPGRPSPFISLSTIARPSFNQPRTLRFCAERVLVVDD